MCVTPDHLADDARLKRVVERVTAPMYYNLITRIQRIEKEVFKETWEETLTKGEK